LLGTEQRRRKHPGWRPPRQHRAREQLELAPARPLVQPTILALADLGWQAGDQGAMQHGVWSAGLAGPITVGGRRRGVDVPPKLLALQLELAVQLAPLPHAQEAEEMPLAPAPQLRLGGIRVRLPVRTPAPEDAGELGLGIGELRMGVVGGGALVGRALARILD